MHCSVLNEHVVGEVMERMRGKSHVWYGVRTRNTYGGGPFAPIAAAAASLVHF